MSIKREKIKHGKTVAFVSGASVKCKKWCLAKLGLQDLNCIFLNSPNPTFYVWQRLFPVAATRIFAFIIWSPSVKEHREKESHFTANVALKHNAIWPFVAVVAISIIYWAEWAGDEVEHYYELKCKLFMHLIVIPLKLAVESAKLRWTHWHIFVASFNAEPWPCVCVRKWVIFIFFLPIRRPLSPS